MPAAYYETRGNKFIITAAVVIFVVVVWIGIGQAFPNPPEAPLTIDIYGEPVFP